MDKEKNFETTVHQSPEGNLLLSALENPPPYLCIIASQMRFWHPILFDRWKFLFSRVKMI